MKMNIGLNETDRQKVECLAEIMGMNNEVVRLLSAYLTECPDFITKELIDGICGEFDLPEEEVFSNLLAAACGLDVENKERDRFLATAYFRPAVRKLDLRQYQVNPYYRNIHIPEVHFGRWDLKYEKYQPYEPFVCNEIVLGEDFKETPQIGFFDTEFTFPAVMQDDNEWMAIKPNEIETMREAIDQVSGHVVTFGLGLGYYAYMVSEKTCIESITIIEKDPEVIRLFETYILPQFPHKHKITIVQTDAFDYAARQMSGQKYSYAFVDLWHDVSDGYPLYLKMKKLETMSPETVFLYWIEDSLLSHMRWQLFHQMREVLFAFDRKNSVTFPQSSQIFSYDQFIRRLENPFLRNLAGENMNKGEAIIG